MEQIQVAVGDGTRTVRLDGPDSKHVVLLLPGSGDSATVFDGVCERLHNSDLRTVVVESIDGLDHAGVLQLLDGLKLGWVNLVGNREGAEIAWVLAARTFGRVASLVVADSGHPAVAIGGEALESDCPPVELPTTILAGKTLSRSDAEQSGRMVYADFRVVDVDGAANIPADAGPEFATEIILRTSPW